MDNNKVRLFESKRIRTIWVENEEEWYFSVVDVVAVLTGQATPRGASNYWAKLKERLLKEGSQLLTNCQQLKMVATDGKERLTDAANEENQAIAKRGGKIAGNTRKEIEKDTGKSVITKKNAIDFSELLSDITKAI